MNLFALKIQSCTDVITNSSSEIFMLHTDSTAEEVDQALSEFTSGYLKPILFKVDEYRQYRRELDSFRTSHPKLTVYDILDGWFTDPSNPEEVLYIQKEYLCGEDYHNKPSEELSKAFLSFLESKGIDDTDCIYSSDIPDEWVEEFLKTHEIPSIYQLIEHSEITYGNVEDLDGCVIVLSESDNTIPYGDFKTINALFNGVNYHLG